MADAQSIHRLAAALGSARVSARSFSVDVVDTDDMGEALAKMIRTRDSIRTGLFSRKDFK